MQTTQDTLLAKHISFEYTSFDRVVLRGYIQGLFAEGSVRATENVRTFTNKDIRTKEGKPFTKMYSVNKFVSQYYIYIDDEKLGLCYLKLSSYLPFVSEFYFNGHNYLKKQFDLSEIEYTMKDNSSTKVENLTKLNDLVSNFKPSIALERISHWMDIFFKFDQQSFTAKGQ